MALFLRRNTEVHKKLVTAAAGEKTARTTNKTCTALLSVRSMFIAVVTTTIQTLPIEFAVSWMLKQKNGPETITKCYKKAVAACSTLNIHITSVIYNNEIKNNSGLTKVQLVGTAVFVITYLIQTSTALKCEKTLIASVKNCNEKAMTN